MLDLYLLGDVATDLLRVAAFARVSGAHSLGDHLLAQAADLLAERGRLLRPLLRGRSGDGDESTSRHCSHVTHGT